MVGLPAGYPVIWKLDRLGRSLKHLVTLTAELLEHEVGLISLNDPIDTTTPKGRLVFNIFASLAEFERELNEPRLVSRRLAPAAVKAGVQKVFQRKLNRKQWLRRRSTERAS